MGGSFSITKVLGLLKSFLMSMPSPMPGFDIEDAKLNTQGDVFSVLLQFKNNESLKDFRTQEAITDISGAKIDLNVLIRVINAQTTFAPIMSAIAEWLGKGPISEWGRSEESKELLDFLLGSDRGDDLTLAGARERGKDGKSGGLLGINLQKERATSVPLRYKGKEWDWFTISWTYLKYSLECQIPGKPHGAIEDQTLSSIGYLMSEYLVKMKVIANESEVQVDTRTLAIPLMEAIQGTLLSKYYESAYNKASGGSGDESGEGEGSDEGADTETPPGSEASGEGAGEGSEGGEPMGDASGSKRIAVTLRKIQGSDEIDMMALQSTCAPADTLNYIDDIINQEEFFDILTEEPQSFNIGIDEDGYDIEECECCEVDPCESLQEVLKAGIRAYRNLYTLHWMATGNDMMKLHNLSEEMYEELIDQIDAVGELLVEKCNTVPSLDFPCDYIPVQPYEFQEGLDQIKSLIQMYVDCIDCAYPNQTSDVQSTLDEWLRYWNKQLNYFVKNQEV